MNLCHKSDHVSSIDAKPKSFISSMIYLIYVGFTCVLKLASRRPAEHKEMDKNKTVLASKRANSN